MKILVTGATGFIGSHLTEGLIRKGHKVKCLVRKTAD
ncbi:MAG: NAD-dependent epimerase/dehydratase family protein, partial [Bacteroidetes bacterium]|nr:NAD-dependent epimerase/dehydratase family protein [Bacteroidota bacterium]